MIPTRNLRKFMIPRSFQPSLLPRLYCRADIHAYIYIYMYIHRSPSPPTSSKDLKSNAEALKRTRSSIPSSRQAGGGVHSRRPQLIAAGATVKRRWCSCQLWMMRGPRLSGQSLSDGCRSFVFNDPVHPVGGDERQPRRGTRRWWFGQVSMP